MTQVTFDDEPQVWPFTPQEDIDNFEDEDEHIPSGYWYKR